MENHIYIPNVTGYLSVGYPYPLGSAGWDFASGMDFTVDLEFAGVLKTHHAKPGTPAS